ncbi:nuclear factor 7, brain-like isoform X2 [Hemitrygon akajei]|uniref:nuclear factor 7, brain-like isoform X2 n=1 Tax=Hemitrygon akajei TaxID=2704970 RepID=UPI003BF99E81
MEDHLSCAVCHDLFQDPVLIDCDHSFCRSCITQYWKRPGTASCPLCRRETSSKTLRPNRTLAGIVESFTNRETTQQECSRHKEKLTLFCQTDKQPLCGICQHSKNHRGHKLLLLEEAVQEFKEELKTSLKPILDKKEECAAVKSDYEETLKHIQKLPETQKRAKRTVPELQKVYPLINVGKHVGSLQYRVWKKMLTVINAAPVILDPNTASPYLLLSDDLRTVRYTDKWMQLPKNPQRFDPCVSVLGSEGFTSGRHSWEVDVGNKTNWDFGIAKDSITRKGKITLNPDNGYWAVALRNGIEYYACTNPWKRLELSVHPRKIRISLEYEGGEVSFHDVDNLTHIYTFNGTFTGKLYPYFSPDLNHDGKNSDPLIICHRRVTIQEDENPTWE